MDLQVRLPLRWGGMGLRPVTEIAPAAFLGSWAQVLPAVQRLVEAGARFVTVFWDPFGPHGASVWDTHSNHFPRLKNYLLPVFDQS